MKTFLKFIAILIILAHAVAGLFYVGIIPQSLFQNLQLPDPAWLAERLQSLQEEESGSEVEAEKSLAENETKETPAEEREAEKQEAQETENQENEAEQNVIQIELSETLPELTEEDLYSLTEVLIEAGALRAVDGHGEDHSDQIICDLAADINDPGRFTAVFSVETEDGQIQRGPSAEFRVELVEPFLAFREPEVTIPLDAEYDPFNNILICMDLDGTVLTEFVERDGYLNTSEPGDYELRFFIYSRVNASSASRIMHVHVTGQ